MHVAQRRALFPVQPDFIMRRIKWAPDVITSYPPDCWSGHGVVEWRNDSDVASAESSSPVTCNPALPTFTLLGQGDSLPSYSLVVRKGEPLGSRWMRTRTVYADPKSEPNQKDPPPCLAVSFPRRRPVILLPIAIDRSGVSSISVSSRLLIYPDKLTTEFTDSVQITVH